MAVESTIRRSRDTCLKSRNDREAPIAASALAISTGRLNVESAVSSTASGAKCDAIMRRSPKTTAGVLGSEAVDYADFLPHAAASAHSTDTATARRMAIVFVTRLD